LIACKLQRYCEALWIEINFLILFRVLILPVFCFNIITAKHFELLFALNHTVKNTQLFNFMYQIKDQILIKASMNEVWDFFATPKNLQKITPKELGFIIKTELPDEMYAGMMVAYTVKPLFNIPLEWITEITQVHKHKYFVDEQRKGPYKMWHHEHHFQEVEGGILTTDIVSYELPLAPLGNLVHPLIVKPKLNEIFNYRTRIIQEYFGA
jgi:ligand-binding SRPBCC domain-containing protein